MPPHNWPVKVAFAVGAIFFGGGDLVFVAGGYSASILLLVGVLLFLEAMSDRELTRSRRSSNIPSSQFDAGPSSVGQSKGSASIEGDQSKPIVDRRTVVQQIADAASAIERANRLLSRPEISTERRAAAQRARAGFEAILRARIARLLAHDGSPTDAPIQPSGLASPPSIATTR